jgi:transcriptional antiterminator NusG
MSDDDQKVLDQNQIEEQQINEPETSGDVILSEAKDLDSSSVSDETQNDDSQQAEDSDTSGSSDIPASDSSDVSDSSEAGDPDSDSSDQADEKSDQPADEVTQDADEAAQTMAQANDVPGARWYVVHTYSGHENRVAATLKQRVESEHLEDKILEVLVPTQEKIEIRGGKKETVKEKIFPGYILVKMVLDDASWLAVRTTQGVTSFIGMSSKPTPISEAEVKSIVDFMQQGGQPTYKQIFSEGDTVKIVDGPFAEFIGKIDSVDKERGKVKVLVSIFGRETPVELDFLQVAKL